MYIYVYIYVYVYIRVSIVIYIFFKKILVVIYQTREIDTIYLTYNKDMTFYVYYSKLRNW